MHFLVFLIILNSSLLGICPVKWLIKNDQCTRVVWLQGNSICLMVVGQDELHIMTGYSPSVNHLQGSLCALKLGRKIPRMGLGSLFNHNITWCNVFAKIVGYLLITSSLETTGRFSTCLRLEGGTLPALMSCILMNVGSFQCYSFDHCL